MRSGGGSEEREQTLNQILVEMDGFDNQTNVIVLAATNRADVLDPAFLRPGRFDRQVMVDNPDYNGRVAILKVHAKNKPITVDVELERIARQTAGFSGADLANLLNEAAIMAARRNKTEIGLAELEEAIDRVAVGPARESRVISEREHIITAYHEVGHALVAKLVGKVDKVQKISIISRGQMGGYTRVAADEDRSLWTKAQLESFMAFALGGHVAEELMFGEVTTGPSNDIEKVSGIARSMVCEYGMSEHFGPVRLGDLNDGMRSANYSNAIAWQVDQEVNRLVTEALNRARQILHDYNAHLIAITNYLLDHEVISGQEMDNIFDQVEVEGLGHNMVAIRPHTPDILPVTTPNPAVTSKPMDVSGNVARENDIRFF
jgi:cell division protease FtsH